MWAPNFPEIDLHGLRAHEAERELEAWIDHLVVSNERQGKIIHGRGQGILERSVRNVLMSHPAVAKMDESLFAHEVGAVLYVTLKG